MSDHSKGRGLGIFRVPRNLAHVSGEAVEQALEGFPLVLEKGCSYEWLAMAVSRAFAVAEQFAPSANRLSNLECRAELRRLSDQLGRTFDALLNISGSSASFLWQSGVRHWLNSGDESRLYDTAPNSSSERFRSARTEIRWLADYLAETSDLIPSQNGPRLQAEARRMRVLRAAYLVPVFEKAFGQKAQSNNYPNEARHSKPTAFMTFYMDMCQLAFGRSEDTNLAKVMREALQSHAKDPIALEEIDVTGF